MPRHECGIMKNTPVTGRRFDKYEPHKYNCISVDDAYILPLLERLSSERFYWHTIDVVGSGLAYYGITLISPESSRRMLVIIADKKELVPLSTLLRKAIEKNCFVIHFGI